MTLVVFYTLWAKLIPPFFREQGELTMVGMDLNLVDLAAKNGSYLAGKAR